MTADAAPTEAGPEEDGGTDATGEVPACTCTGDLSNVGLGSFTIAFTLTTTANGQNLAILNQRSDCTADKPGWDVWLDGQGQLVVQVFGGLNDDTLYTNALNDGKAHRVVITRTSAAADLTIDIDDIGGSTAVPPQGLFGTLPTLQVGTDLACMGNGVYPAPFADNGTLNNVCVAPGRCNAVASIGM